MEVDTTPVSLGKAQLLIINNGPDTLSVGEFGQDEDDWFPLESGSAVTVKAFNNGIGVVSEGVSDVGVLVGGTGIFPPAVDAPDLSGYETTAAHNASLAAYSPFGKAQPIVTVTGTTHTISSAEAGSLVRCTSNSAVTITVPKDVSDDVPDGVYYDVEQVGDGQITVVAESGATIIPLTDFVFKSRVKGSRLGLQKVAANTFSIFGDLEGA